MRSSPSSSSPYGDLGRRGNSITMRGGGLLEQAGRLLFHQREPAGRIRRMSAGALRHGGALSAGGVASY